MLVNQSQKGRTGVSPTKGNVNITVCYKADRQNNISLIYELFSQSQISEYNTLILIPEDQNNTFIFIDIFLHIVQFCIRHSVVSEF